ncbi:MAG: hypothetical protein JWQ57_2128 [Mucilaginibacter sp.]|nr:hypothetical protein [Mucilaginibacter sp.]
MLTGWYNKDLHIGSVAKVSIDFIIDIEIVALIRNQDPG